MTPRDPNGIRMEESRAELRDEPEAALPSTTGDDDIEVTAAQENFDDVRCDDCGEIVSHGRWSPGKAYENYNVHDPVWEQAGLGRGHLCVGCLENRLGRQLNRSDFTDQPVNSLGPEVDDYAWSDRTPRLRDRLTRNAAADGTIGGGDAGDGASQEAPLDVAGLGEFGAAYKVVDRQPADHPNCPGAKTVWLTEGSEPRCSVDGHRVADPETGRAPEHTRDMGLMQMVREMPSREWAKRAAYGPTAMGDQSVAEGLSGGAQEPSVTGQQPGMGSMDEPLMPDDQSIQTIGTQQWSGGGADSDETAVEPGQPQGSIDDIVASFQRSAAAGAYAGGGGGAPQGEPGDIAAAARAYLSKTADVLPQAEADELVREGRGQRARNLDLLDLKDTHYEDSDDQKADEHEDDMLWV
jgi:hypothetical protein